MRLVPLVFGLTLAMPALAQFGNPGGDDPATRHNLADVPSPGPDDTNVQDRLFAKLMTLGGMAEVELAKLASEKAQNVVVKEFAKTMANDHGKANREFSDLAKRIKLMPAAGMDPEHQAVKEELARIGKGEFDLTYMRAQIVDHQKTMQLLEWEIGMGENADIQHFASATLPIVAQHLQMAQNIISDLSGAVRQGAAAESVGSNTDRGHH
jgi:putative membrane protein